MAPPGSLVVTLDKLPLKRVLALEEAGLEILPIEPTPEEKPLHLLSRIDFGHTVEKDTKKIKAGKDAPPPPPAAWPWQGLAENLQQAQQELNIILDLLTHVEANEAVQVVNMMKPKMLPHETFNEICLRAAAKNNKFREVGKYLKKTAQALERQVEREAVFYGALMRLQRNWKVKRQRGVSAGPGGSAGFSIDLSFPLPADSSSGSSARAAALASVNLDQDVSGLLQALTPSGKPLNKLNISLRSTQPGRTVWERQDVKDEDWIGKVEDPARGSDVAGSQNRGVGEGVDTGAKGAQVVLRRIQAVIFDEQVFEWVGREALMANSGMNVLGIGDTCLQFSLGHSASLTLELSESAKRNHDLGPTDAQDDEDGNDEDEDGGKLGPTKSATNSQTLDKADAEWSSLKLYGRRIIPNERALVVCLHQAFHQCVFGYPTVLPNGLVTFKLGHGKNAVDTPVLTKTREPSSATGASGPAKESVSGDGASAIKHFSAIMRHRVLCNRVLAELEKQVTEIPHLQLSFHPTWHPRVSAWDLSLVTPVSSQRGKDAALTENKESWFQCTIVLRDESLTVEGLEGESRFEAPSKTSPQEILPLNIHNVGISELPTFLLFQIATELVSWLHDEAVNMGLKVSRDLLSVVFQLESCDDVAIVACPDVKAHCINWWMRTWGFGMDESSGKEDMVSENGHHQRFLGPLSLDILRKVLLDLISLESQPEAGSYD
ncbi:mediator of RNA polymerase II transcription subunit 17 [Marchantia polymorpha subsp. ruderalis]|uniref:Mediator complex subunit 17 n=2 Tax=Marchantia polymorpha TaxID=3197 RepID=A0A176VIQ6_MARPO|nr:hypothetical protein AXG93_1219s1000 [Marchantia polymorpha subsp. ruderalis]PTQ46614.1 hypothetical protein MARPO_0010s0026 [Marchantia polymorpha]BBN12956.1 hypothetical protein Mp_5g24300 [Marchantia polymorpha subsp. ruderalis]|eukprot:PTQ46614.1 hypothetical protein MARPO_0010s0026 [Marchantia polymorpha]